VCVGVLAVGAGKQGGEFEIEVVGDRRNRFGADV